jgi:hypothetical protein
MKIGAVGTRGNLTGSLPWETRQRTSFSAAIVKVKRPDLSSDEHERDRVGSVGSAWPNDYAARVPLARQVGASLYPIQAGAAVIGIAITGRYRTMRAPPGNRSCIMTTVGSVATE